MLKQSYEDYLNTEILSSISIGIGIYCTILIDQCGLPSGTYIEQFWVKSEKKCVQLYRQYSDIRFFDEMPTKSWPQLRKKSVGLSCEKQTQV